MAVGAAIDGDIHVEGGAQPRRTQDLAWSADTDEPPLVHQRHPIREPGGRVQIVQHGDRGQAALPGGGPQQVEDMKLMRDVQRTRRFVEQQHARVGGEHLGDQYICR